MSIRPFIILLIVVAAMIGTGCSSSSNQASVGTSTSNIKMIPGPTEAPPVGYSMITPEGLQAKIDTGEKLTIIDLREPIVYAEGHIPGAKNISFDEFDARMKELNPQDKIVLVCHTGPMGDSAASRLVKNGYTQVWNVVGGMAAWQGKLEK